MFGGVLKSNSLETALMSSHTEESNTQWSIFCDGLFSSTDILQGAGTF